jgi:hypothetical protein
LLPLALAAQLATDRESEPPTPGSRR